MRLTKFGHACVRLEHDGVTLVIDPGTWTEREAVDGATAVLITHEHPDHYHPDHLLATDAPVLTIEAVAAQYREDAPALAERLQVVTPERGGRRRAPDRGRGGAARSHPSRPAAVRQLRLPGHGGRHPRLPSRRRAHRAGRARRRAVRAGLRPVAEVRRRPSTSPATSRRPATSRSTTRSTPRPASRSSTATSVCCSVTTRSTSGSPMAPTCEAFVPRHPVSSSGPSDLTARTFYHFRYDVGFLFRGRRGRRARGRTSPATPRARPRDRSRRRSRSRRTATPCRRRALPERSAMPHSPSPRASIQPTGPP